MTTKNIYTYVNGVLVSTETVDVPQVDVNTETLYARAVQALANNQTFLAIGAPTQAQGLAQVQSLTRQVDGLIRVLLNRFDTISDA